MCQLCVKNLKKILTINGFYIKFERNIVIIKLDKLIKKIDIYSILDKEFNRKRAKKGEWIIAAIISFIVISLILIAILIDLKYGISNKRFLRGFLGYHILSIWSLMLLDIPIKNSKKLNIS